MSVATVIEEMVARIVRQFDPEKIILFGSHARGDAGKWSDVDLLVVMPDGTKKHDTTVAILNALSNLPAAKDIIVATDDEIERRGHINGSVFKSALQEGRLLYERG